MSHKIAIALGGNQGDTKALFKRAIGMLADKVSNIRQASCHITKPVNCVPGTPDFTNSAITGEFEGTPEELLALTQSIEVALGRPAAHSSMESRTIDLDILLYDDLQLHTTRLTIPHPRMGERAFVLLPLAELIPDDILPGTSESILELARKLA